ncbi:MAG: hypothetical protein CL455_06595 [Acidimicrobiaceae bacterium]|nr:hypothetical protein [Acidimicrobiaceae bacterium]
MNSRRMNFFGLFFGAGFGGILAAGTLHEYDTIHAMLRLDEFYVYGFMGSGIIVATAALWIFEKKQTTTLIGSEIKLQRSKPQTHHIKGAAVFGTGWAIAGTCPAPALVMLASGGILASIAITGIFLGIHLASKRGDLKFGDGEHHQVTSSFSN